MDEKVDKGSDKKCEGGNVHQGNEQLGRVLQWGSLIKMLGGWAVGLLTIVISIVFWVQSQGADKFYPRLKGESLEADVAKLDQRLVNLEHGNLEIIRLLGRLEGLNDRLGPSGDK